MLQFFADRRKMKKRKEKKKKEYCNVSWETILDTDGRREKEKKKKNNNNTRQRVYVLKSNKTRSQETPKDHPVC